MREQINSLKLLAVIVVFILGLFVGSRMHQKDVRDRALTIEDKDCYSNQEVEYIIFGQIQE